MHIRHLLAIRLMIGATQLGCALGQGDLEAFRDTATGPRKLRAIVRDGRREPALRGEAALCLLDLERTDFDGRALLFEALEGLEPTARHAIVPTFEAGLEARMATPRGTTPSPRTVRAKDAGVRLLALLDEPARARLGGALVRWVGEDPERRADSGTFTLEHVAAEIGAVSAAVSTENLRPDLSPAALARLVATVEQHADLPTRGRAGERIVALEQAYRTQPARRPDIVAHALPALGRFVDTEAARRRLVAVARDATLDEAERARALDLLAGHAVEADLVALGEVALDDGAAIALREAALGRVLEVRSPTSLPTLLTLAASRAHRSLRQPAAELAIDLGGERGLPALFRVLPSHWNVTYARSELSAYAERVERLRATSYLVTLLGKKLYSPFWWSRVIAIRYFAHRAEPLDAARRLRQQIDEKQEIVGADWPAKWTVGREAQLALRMMAAR